MIPKLVRLAKGAHRAATVRASLVNMATKLGERGRWEEHAYNQTPETLTLRAFIGLLKKLDDSEEELDKMLANPYRGKVPSHFGFLLGTLQSQHIYIYTYI